jgi:GNAT superfamily N-acetyltransferase
MELSEHYSLKLADNDSFLPILKEALEASPYAGFPYTDESLKRTIELFLSDRATKVIVLLCFDGIPVGLIAGAITPNLLCPHLKVASEAIFYVSPEHRGKHSFKLVDAYEYWAEMLGADIVLMANFGNETLDKLYKRKGYTLVEHSFIKELNS